MISPRLAVAATVLTVAIAVPSVVVAAEASSASTVRASTVQATVVHAAQPKATHYKNCTAVHKVYSGGIAKPGVKYNKVVSGGKTVNKALKGKVKFSTAGYAANKSLDRDKDGIACELG